MVHPESPFAFWMPDPLCLGFTWRYAPGGFLPHPLLRELLTACCLPGYVLGVSIANSRVEQLTGDLPVQDGDIITLELVPTSRPCLLPPDEVQPPWPGPPPADGPTGGPSPAGPSFTTHGTVSAQVAETPTPVQRPGRSRTSITYNCCQGADEPCLCQASSGSGETTSRVAMCTQVVLQAALPRGPLLCTSALLVVLCLLVGVAEQDGLGLFFVLTPFCAGRPTHGICLLLWVTLCVHQGRPVAATRLHSESDRFTNLGTASVCAAPTPLPRRPVPTPCRYARLADVASLIALEDHCSPCGLGRCRPCQPLL